MDEHWYHPLLKRNDSSSYCVLQIIEPMTSSLKSDYDVDGDRLETEFVNVSNEIEISEDSFYDVIETDESSLKVSYKIHRAVKHPK
jgi:hypothetical protein